MMSASMLRPIRRPTLKIVARAYGSYEPQEGAAERALFVIDRAGVIRWSYLSPMDVNPGADGILKALESLS